VAINPKHTTSVAETVGQWNPPLDEPDGKHKQMQVPSSVVIAVLALFPAEGISGVLGAQPVDACTLLTAGELSTLFGMPVEAGVRHDDGLTSQGAYSSTCIWKVRNERLLEHNPKASLRGADFAILDVFSWASRGSAETLLRSFQIAAQRGLIPMHPVPLDIGDDSLWWGDGVAVRIGAVSFGISVVLHSADRDKRRGWEESLAKDIVTRIRSKKR
jgi:hypothetical protein